MVPKFCEYKAPCNLPEVLSVWFHASKHLYVQTFWPPPKMKIVCARLSAVEAIIKRPRHGLPSIFCLCFNRAFHSAMQHGCSTQESCSFTPHKIKLMPRFLRANFLVAHLNFRELCAKPDHVVNTKMSPHYGKVAPFWASPFLAVSVEWEEPFV